VIHPPGQNCETIQVLDERRAESGRVKLRFCFTLLLFILELNYLMNVERPMGGVIMEHTES
jgi:hypothetical protein